MTRRTSRSAPLSVTEVAAIVDAYRARGGRLDALMDDARPPADRATTRALLDAHAAFACTSDAHGAYACFAPLEHARGDVATDVVRALAARVTSSRASAQPDALVRTLELALERIADLAAFAPDDVIPPLIAYARARFATGPRAVWDDRWAFESVWKIGAHTRARSAAARAQIRALAVSVVNGLVGCQELAGDGSLFQCAVDALMLVRAHARAGDALTASERAAVCTALACDCVDVVRAAADALHAILGSSAYGAHVAELVPVLARAGRFRGDIDTVTPDAYVGPLLAARADWFDVLVALLAHAPAFAPFTNPGRLLRSRHATPARVAALEALARSRTRAVRDATLAVLAELPPRARARPSAIEARAASSAGAVGSVQDRITRFERLPMLVPRNPYERAPVAALGDDELVWIPQQEILDGASPGEWLNDTERLGVRGVHPTNPRRDRALWIPFVWPMTPTGAAGDKRILRVIAARSGRVLASVREGFADDSGWGSRNFLLRLDVATGAWSLLTSAGARALHADTALRVEDAWCGGELVAWSEGDAVHTHADLTPYFLDDATPTRATRARRRRADRARARTHLDDLALAREPWLRGVDVLGAIRDACARVELDEPVLELLSAGRVSSEAGEDDALMFVVAASDPDTQEPIADLVVTLRVAADHDGASRSRLARNAEAIPETKEAGARAARAPEERRQAGARGSRRAARGRARHARDDLGQAR